MAEDYEDSSIVIDEAKGYVAYQYLDNNNNTLRYGIPMSLIQKAHSKSSQYMDSWMNSRKNQLERDYGRECSDNAFPKVVLLDFGNKHARRVIRIDYFAMLKGILLDFERDEMFAKILVVVDEITTLAPCQKRILKSRIENMAYFSSCTRKRSAKHRRPPVHNTCFILQNQRFSRGQGASSYASDSRLLSDSLAP